MRLLNFPVLHLDESYHLLTEHFRYYQIQQRLRNLTDATKNPLWREDPKGIIDFLTKYSEQDLQDYAQNVLTHYPIPDHELLCYSSHSRYSSHPFGALFRRYIFQGKV